MFKKTIASMLSAVVCLSSLTAFATNQNVYTLQETPPSNSDVLPTGIDPPYDAGTHDLTSGPYDYQVDSMGAQLYTDRWITGASHLKITVDYFMHIDGSPAYSYDTVKFTLMNSAHQEVSSVSVNVGDGRPKTCYIRRIVASHRYYIKIEVTNDRLLKTFGGRISKA